MGNDNPSRENPSRQQSSERAQTSSPSSQQGANPGSQRSAGGGAQQSGGALQTHRGTAMSPYASGYGSGPFSVMRRISDEMDRLFEGFGMGRGMFPGEWDQAGLANYGVRGEGAPAMWSPHVELRERNGKLVIEADLPGLKRDDINVRIEQDQVIIQGQRRQEQSSNQGTYYRSERRYGSFYRTIPLPEGTDPDSASASFHDGVLEIELEQPRAQQRGRTLEIHDGNPGRKNG